MTRPPPSSALTARIQGAVAAWYVELQTHPKDFTGPLNVAFIRTVGSGVVIQALLGGWTEPATLIRRLAVAEAKRYLGWLGTAATPRRT